MSCSKPLPPFACDSLYYLNRDQLERFSIVCRQLKNFIERYLHTKPYRVFDCLSIRGGTYSLFHNGVQWQPNRDDYSVQQFLAGEYRHTPVEYYSFAEMRPFLSQAVRIKYTLIYLENGITYNPEHIEEMESITHLWCDRKINVWKGNRLVGIRIVADDFQLILDSPTILQCQTLYMTRAQFSFKDYKVLYSAKIIEIVYFDDATDPDYWAQFLEQSVAKPLIVWNGLDGDSINTVLDHISKAFSTAVSPNAFKIVIAHNRKPLTEFQQMNETSGEKLELKRGLPTEYQEKGCDKLFDYTLERSSI